MSVESPLGDKLPPPKSGKTGDGNGTLYQFVYSSLRQRILNGEWLPETKLTLRWVAAELGTSNQPVREAMNRLVAERALVLRPNYCVSLPPVDRSLLDELWFLRTTLEGEAARLCVSRLTTEDFAELDDALQELIHFHRPDLASYEGSIRSHNRIPFLIAARSGSSHLRSEIENLRLRTASYYAAVAAKPKQEKDFIAFAMKLQEEFVHTLKRGNGEAARDIWRAAIYTYQHYLYRQLGLE